MATLPEPRIDRTSPVPFYFQLVSVLREEIVSSRWKPGERLPSELELCSHFGVSRTVVRQALARLENERLLRREKGRGTFVADTHERSWQLQSSAGFFHDEVGRLGLEVTSELLHRETAVLPDWAADALDRPRGTQGASIARLRFVEGQVALYTVNYVIPEASDTVLGLEADASLYEALEREHGLVVHGGRRMVEAVIAGEQLGGLLRVPAASAVAFIESVSWDEDMRPFDCFQAWLVTERMRIELAVTRSAAGLGQAAAYGDAG
jgi:GntR family transcriptional regulator